MRAPRVTCCLSVSSRLSLLAISLLLWPGLIHASEGLAAPTPHMIDLMRQHHSAKDWLRVTSGSDRLELRVDKIESDGLHGFEARSRTSLPSMLPWSSIRRIDRRESRFRSGQTLGLVLGGIAGGLIGASAANGPNRPTLTLPDGTVLPGSTGHPGRGALIGLAVGGIAAGWLGGRLGDGIVYERPLYVAGPNSASEPMATTPAELKAVPPAPAEDWVDAVRARITPGDLLRVTGSFGRFSGRAGAIDERGLSGLQQDLAFDSSLPLPSEPLSWAEINRIDRRGTSSGRFARYGGVGLGVVTGSFMAMLVNADFLSPSTADFGDSARGFAGGFVVGGLAGAGIGALVGAWVPRWQLVHRRSPSR